MLSRVKCIRPHHSELVFWAAPVPEFKECLDTLRHMMGFLDMGFGHPQ